jgi:hypothetical protein
LRRLLDSKVPNRVEERRAPLRQPLAVVSAFTASRRATTKTSRRLRAAGGFEISQARSRGRRQP